MSASVRYCGREFPASELALIRALIAQRQPRLSRSALSRAVCAALQWRKPDGGLKEMSARVALLRMQRDGLLTLPPALPAAAPGTSASSAITTSATHPCLASHLLACLERQLPHDWHERYRIRPVLLETFCETPRFAGTCYRAANWIHLGQTQGRGKLDTRREYAKPVKNIFVKPLCPDWKAILNR